MKTLSIHKSKTSSASEAVGKWWNSKNVFFSLLAEENFTNKEVVLIHLILMAFLIGTALVETYPVISILAIIASAVCVRILNGVGNNINNVSN